MRRVKHGRRGRNLRSNPVRAAPIIFAVLMLGAGHEAAACEGCGCRGGPGYRGPDGKCVAWDHLDSICGKPPTKHCSRETGETSTAKESAAPDQRGPVARVRGSTIEQASQALKERSLGPLLSSCPSGRADRASSRRCPQARVRARPTDLGWVKVKTAACGARRTATAGRCFSAVHKTDVTAG